MTQECSNHHRFLSTLRSKGLSQSKMKWWATYTNLRVNAIVRLPHPQILDSQGQRTFLVPSADKQTCNYDTGALKQPLSISRSKGLSRRKMKWWAIYTNLPVKAIVILPHPQNGDSQGDKRFWSPSPDKQTCNYDTGVLQPPSLPINTMVKWIEP